MKASGLRGRGGAGFPTGVKWGFIPPNNTKPVYLICNADESEPGTFKDRYILHQDPHQLIEGMLISCFAVGANLAYIYIREEFPEGAEIVEEAIREAHERGFLGKKIDPRDEVRARDLRPPRRGCLHLRRGDGTDRVARGQASVPAHQAAVFPAALGLYMCPTIVNNVESLCHVKHIIEMGGEKYSKIGMPRNTGTRILCVSGDVKKPGYYEIEVGKLTMGGVINDLCGGMKKGRKLKAVIPGGSSSKVLRADEKFTIKDGDRDKEIGLLDIPMDFDTLAACGSMAGSGGVIVMDDSRDDGVGDQQPERVLRTRVLRAVHAVPRGLALDEEDHRAHGEGPGPAGRREDPAVGRRQHRGARPSARSGKPARGRPKVSSTNSATS